MSQAQALRLHVLGYGEARDRSHPALRVVDAPGGEIKSLPLQGPFAWRVEGVRLCIGRRHEGRHVPCPDGATTGADAQCISCSGLENPACIFEPVCQYNPAACSCLASFRGVEHVVYAAFYGTLPKVGMTQAWRVERRLREQGADAYFVIQSGLERPTARLAEKGLAMLYRLPEHRSHREVLPQLARPVPWEVVSRRAEELRLRLEQRYPVERILHRITDHPVAQPLASVPHRIPVHGAHSGHWLGAKGHHLFYQEAPRANRLTLASRPIAALKGPELVGHHILLETVTDSAAPDIAGAETGN